MHIKTLQAFVTTADIVGDSMIERGVVIEVADRLALAWIEIGLAERVAETAVRKKAIEIATRKRR
jgi:hypothetical protein